MINVTLVGSGYWHENTIWVEREALEVYLLLFFHTPMKVMLEPNMSIITKPFTFIIYDKKQYQHFCGVNRIWSNDFVCFDGEDIEYYLKDLNISCNKLYEFTKNNIITNGVHLIEEEFSLEKPYKNQMIDVQVKQFLINISRLIKNKDVPMNTVPKDVQNQFMSLRQEINLSLGKGWSVPMMAEKVNYSTSYFSKIYQLCFGISPKQDLIQRQINMAKYHLQTYGMSVAEIGRIVGYTNEYQFSYQFKKMTGFSPSKFREMCVAVK